MRVFLGKSQDSENMQSMWTYSKAEYLRLRVFMISFPSPVFFSLLVWNKLIIKAPSVSLMLYSVWETLNSIDILLS